MLLPLETPFQAARNKKHRLLQLCHLSSLPDSYSCKILIFFRRELLKRKGKTFPLALGKESPRRLTGRRMGKGGEKTDSPRRKDGKGKPPFISRLLASLTALKPFSSMILFLPRTRRRSQPISPFLVGLRLLRRLPRTRNESSREERERERESYTQKLQRRMGCRVGRISSTSCFGSSSCTRLPCFLPPCDLHPPPLPPPFPRIRSISPFIYLRTSIDVDLFVRLLRRTSPFVLQ